MVDKNKGVMVRQPTNVLANIDLVNDKATAMEIFKDLVASGKMNVTNPAEVMAMYIKSQELGIPFMTATDHMHMVNGKAGVDIHILRAKLLTAGCIVWKLVHDYAPLYEYKDSRGTLVGTHYTDDELLEIYTVPQGNNGEELGADVVRIKSIGKIPVFKSPSIVALDKDGKHTTLNRGTIIKFTREVKLLNDTTETLVEYGRFTTYDMVAASLHLKRDRSVSWDSPHIKYERIMQEHRAWTFGGRKIGADILLGMYETKEVYDMTNTDYEVDDQGEANIVKDNSE